MAFAESFRVSWAHLDGNGHMANTSYMLIAIDCRFHYFASRGFAPEEFARQRIGPVVRNDSIDYFRELHLLQTVRVDLRCAGLAPDASRFRIVNGFFLDDGQLAARVTSLGGWFDLQARKLIAPPAGIAQALRDLERTPEFEDLPSSLRLPDGKTEEACEDRSGRLPCSACCASRARRRPPRRARRTTRSSAARTIACSRSGPRTPSTRPAARRSPRA